MLRWESGPPACVSETTHVPWLFIRQTVGQERRDAEDMDEKGQKNGRMRRRSGVEEEEESGGQRCNPDGTRIRMTHGIIWVYVIREIRRR